MKEQISKGSTSPVWSKQILIRLGKVGRFSSWEKVSGFFLHSVLKTFLTKNENIHTLYKQPLFAFKKKQIINFYWELSFLCNLGLISSKLYFILQKMYVCRLSSLLVSASFFYKPHFNIFLLFRGMFTYVSPSRLIIENRYSKKNKMPRIKRNWNLNRI